jgi:hypothetical protein
MRTLRLIVDLTYDEQIMHGEDKESINWFFENVMRNNTVNEQLILHSNYIGDEVGEIKVIEIMEPVDG